MRSLRNFIIFGFVFFFASIAKFLHAEGSDPCAGAASKASAALIRGTALKVTPLGLLDRARDPKHPEADRTLLYVRSLLREGAPAIESIERTFLIAAVVELMKSEDRTVKDDAFSLASRMIAKYSSEFAVPIDPFQKNELVKAIDVQTKERLNRNPGDPLVQELKAMVALTPNAAENYSTDLARRTLETDIRKEQTTVNQLRAAVAANSTDTDAQSELMKHQSYVNRMQGSLDLPSSWAELRKTLGL